MNFRFREIHNSHTPMPKTAIVNFIETNFPINDLKNEKWERASRVKVKSLWSGQRAPKTRRFEARMLWSNTTLYVRFDANQGEPPVINKFPRLDRKASRLWERDVCELFIAPDRSSPQKYFEFEIAPTGEWVDLQIEHVDGERRTNDNYVSLMQTMSSISHDLMVMAFKVDWRELGAKPEAGDIWLGNLLRCVGKGPTRGYLSWSATRTEVPNFHVPEKFGEFVFVK